MLENDEVNIKKLIVHILDQNLQIPLLSQQEHTLDGEIVEFLEKHIKKILKDDNLKHAAFVGVDNNMKQLCEALVGAPEQFSVITSAFATIIFDIMQKHIDIAPADLVCCLFENEKIPYLGILKFNYRPSFIHYVDMVNEGRVNSIIKQKTTLPGEGQRIEEAAVINLKDYRINLIERKYEIDGEKTFYFSELFLQCSAQTSVNEKVKLFTKATEKFGKKYFEEDFTKGAEIKKAVAQSIEQTEAIDVEDVAKTVFKQDPELRKEYIEEVRKAVKEETIPVTEKIAQKKFKRQKIRTDNGIEINLPIEFYGDNDKIEFINNPDGTISIMIKNIGRITNK